MRRRYMYKLRRVRGGYTWPKGEVIWSAERLRGWKVIAKVAEK